MASGIEIEWKFIVERLPAPPDPATGTPILQAYLTDRDPTVRVRVKGSAGFLTIKADPPEPAAETGPGARLEFEYPIPVEDARRLITLSDLRVEKTRHLLPGGIELDVFEGRHSGLVMAEIEVADANAPAPQPPPGWQWRDVSRERGYSNRALAEHGIPAKAPLCRIG